MAENDIVGRLKRNAGWRNEQWHCITDPALLTEAAAEIESLRAQLAARDAVLRRISLMAEDGADIHEASDAALKAIAARPQRSE